MDLENILKEGLSPDNVKVCRKDWSLAHDVNLLKYLENYSKKLISRTGQTLTTLEEFEKDLSSLSLNIQTVSQRFQSLGNKQFIEHCVLEDDLSVYSKPPNNTKDIPKPVSNVLNKALSSCLSSLESKYNYQEQGYINNRSNHSSRSIHSLFNLPPLIGSEGFIEYYSKLSLKKQKLNMDKPKIQNTETDTSLLIPNGSFKLINNKSFVPNNNSIDDYSQDNVSVEDVVPSESSTSCYPIEYNENTIDDCNMSGENSGWKPESRVISNNGYSFVPPPPSQSLFDDDQEEVYSHDLFSSLKQSNLFEQSSVFSDKSDEIFNNKKSCANSYLTEDIKDVQSELLKNKDNSHKLPKIISQTNIINKNIGVEITDYLTKNADNLVNEQHTSASNEKPEVVLNSSASFNESLKVSDNNNCDVKPAKPIYSLFSDDDNSDDDLLFNPSNSNNSKEAFKKVLGGKISAMGPSKNNSTPREFKKQHDKGSSVIEKTDEITVVKVNKKMMTDYESENDKSLPSIKTATLQSLSKNRAKIKNKRRPPTRQHLKRHQSSETLSADSGGNAKDSNNSVSILSPSTEEEDLFIVPQNQISHDSSCSNLFSTSSLLSPGSSLDIQHLCSNSNDDKIVNYSSITDNDSLYKSDFSKKNSSCNSSVFSNRGTDSLSNAKNASKTNLFEESDDQFSKAPLARKVSTLSSTTHNMTLPVIECSSNSDDSTVIPSPIKVNPSIYEKRPDHNFSSASSLPSPSPTKSIDKMWGENEIDHQVKPLVINKSLLNSLKMDSKMNELDRTPDNHNTSLKIKESPAPFTLTGLSHFLSSDEDDLFSATPNHISYDSSSNLFASNSLFSPRSSLGIENLFSDSNTDSKKNASAVTDHEICSNSLHKSDFSKVTSKINLSYDSNKLSKSGTKSHLSMKTTVNNSLENLFTSNDDLGKESNDLFSKTLPKKVLTLPSTSLPVKECSSNSDDSSVIPSLIKVNPSIYEKRHDHNFSSASSLLSPSPTKSIDKMWGENEIDHQVKPLVINKSPLNSLKMDSKMNELDRTVKFKESPPPFTPPFLPDVPFPNSSIQNDFYKTDNSNVFWNNSSSLFNDSDDDDDDLFSSKLLKKLDKNLSDVKGTSSTSKITLKKESYNDLFLNNSDEDDDSLFKSDQTNTLKINSKNKKNSKQNRPNGNNISSATSEFEDPLSSFSNNEA